MERNTVFLAYVPVINHGYVKLFDQFRCYGHFLGVLNDGLLSNWPHLARDVRALNPEVVVEILQCYYRSAERIFLATPNILEKMIDSPHWRFILPDDDISHELADKWLIDRSVEFIPIWLRWDKKNADSEKLDDPDRSISVQDQEILFEAYSVAERSSDWWRQVGAILVSADNQVIQSFNQHLPTEYSPYIDGDPRSNFSWGEKIECSTAIHAEASVITKAAREGIVTDKACLYVTTLPCPNCARLIVAAGIKRVYYHEGYSRADAREILKLFNVELVRVELPR